MAHMVESMFFTGETPWHKLGVKLLTAPTTEQAIKAAGLDWTVVLKPAFLADGTPIPAQAIVRETDGSVLGVTGPDYRALQNAEAFRFFDGFLAAGEAKLETAGALRGGQRVWVLAKIAGAPHEIIPGDEVQSYILLSNSHDGKLAVRIGYTPVRVVCHNTLTMAENASGSKLLRVLHTGRVVTALDEIRKTMDVARRAFVATADQYRKLASCRVVEKDLRTFVQRVFRKQPANAPTPAQVSVEGTSGSAAIDEVLESTVTQDILFSRVQALYEGGRGTEIKGVRGSMWGAYNAVTEYLTHERGKSEDTRLDSGWFGQGAAINRRALGVALDMASATQQLAAYA